MASFSDFDDLTDRFIADRLRPEELPRFFAFLEQEGPRLRYAERLDLDFLQEAFIGWSNPQQSDEIYKRILAAAGITIDAPDIKPITDVPVRRIYFLQKAWFKYAAAIVIVLGSVAYFWNKTSDSSKRTSSMAVLNSKADVSAPSSTRATLTLANGQQIFLDSAGNGTIALQGNSEIIKKDGQIIYGNKEGNSSYRALAGHGSEPSYPPLAGVSRSDGGGPNYNTLTVPRGSQIASIVLSDGTKVLLNAASSITYPVVFDGERRSVKIIGEVYFEVARNKQKPFIVDIDGKSSVEVLGTHFNVNAYNDEPSINTTLLEGSVRIRHSGAAMLLSPGQQSRITEGSARIQLVKAVDTENSIAWTKGMFPMKETDIRVLIRQIARWYDIEVVENGPLPSTTFGGSISRNVPLSDMRKALRIYGVESKMENRKLILKPK